MKIYRQPTPESWEKILQRPTTDQSAQEAGVRQILEQVASQGDAALRELTQRFDGVQLQELELPSESLQQAWEQLPAQLQEAIQTAADNIERFHASQADTEQIIETMPGVQCWRRSVPIERVGLYVPGGTAPLLSTVLMLAIPARLAGCPEVILCTPPGGKTGPHPALLAAAHYAGVKRVFQVGGAQAVAAMAYGTRSIPKVDKIFGPGNSYVTLAKQLVQQNGVAIDLPAGPSEVMVVADQQANPEFIAADLLSQAEHGVDSQVVLVCFEESTLEATQEALQRQLANLPRRQIATYALENSVGILVDAPSEAIGLINTYAPEHLILNVASARNWIPEITQAGSVFLGNYTPESVGDYASGTNHTLPTAGYARAYSGVSLDSFVRKITYQEVSPEGLQNLGPTVALLAEAEELEAHRQAVQIRLNQLNTSS
jgi:histidinol dehydrogenase